MKKMMQIDCKLPPEKRVQIILNGGKRNKKNLIEKSPKESADFIANLLIDRNFVEK